MRLQLLRPYLSDTVIMSFVSPFLSITQCKVRVKGDGESDSHALDNAASGYFDSSHILSILDTKPMMARLEKKTVV